MIVIRITVLFMLITNVQTLAQENTQTVQKELPAIKTDQSPTIDGVLNDACWQEAPQAIGFTDERTEKPAKNQSVGRVVYTDTAIYVGLHLYDDMPDKIVARQTKDQTRIRGEDWVSFSLDPFHTPVSRQKFLYRKSARHKIRASCYGTCREKRMDWTLEGCGTDCGRRLDCRDGNPVADAGLSRYN